MNQQNSKGNASSRGGANSPRPSADSQAFDKLNKAADSGILSRLSNRFNDALQSGRGSGPVTASQPSLSNRNVDEIALLRARSTRTQKMHIPNGVIIEGSITGGSETEIHGRIEGNVTVEGVLYLGKTALVTGNVRADSCQLEGMIEGKVECSDSLIIAATGRLSADAVAGKQIRIAGRIDGNATTPGALSIAASGVVNGDIQARVFSMDEGATLDGRCTMRAPAQRENDKKESEVTK